MLYDYRLDNLDVKDYYTNEIIPMVMKVLSQKSYLGISPLPTWASIIIEAMLPPTVPESVKMSPMIPI